LGNVSPPTSSTGSTSNIDFFAASTNSDKKQDGSNLMGLNFGKHGDLI
jgi:hypothetical protein